MPISKIKSSAIDANAITGAGIADGTVDTADLANGAVTSAKLDTNIDIAGTLDVTGAFTADSYGSVAGTFGIGTTSPGQTLEVNTGNDSNGIRIRRFSGSYYSDIVHTSTPEGLKFMVGNGASVTERLRILGSGGITFNGDTAAANALDDYEEGTWTPIINDASYGDITTTTNHATYTKIGNLVYLDFYLTRNDSASATSTMFITNLPFGSLPASARIGGHAWWDNASSDWRTFIYLGGSSTSAYVLVPGNSSTYLTTNLFENGRYVYGSMCYRAS